MGEQSLGEKDLGLSPIDPRTAAIPPLTDFVRGQETTIGTTAEQRVAWLRGLQPVDFNRLLTDLNATVRGITGGHTFDGENVQAGTIAGSVPPDQRDKEPILHYALTEVQRIGQEMLSKGATSQDFLDRAAVILPTIVNKLHLFDDGNGRTSRVLRMLLRDGTINADSGIEAIVSKDRFNNYDTTPATPIEWAIITEMRKRHGTQQIEISDDVDQGTAEATLAKLSLFKDINPRIATSIQDQENFSETARVFTLTQNSDPSELDGVRNVSLRELFTELGSNPTRQEEFLGIYRNVRREKVTLWVDGLTSKVELPIGADYPTYSTWIASINNWARKAKGQEPLTDQDVNTAEKLQTAYVESQAPLRTQ